MSDTAAGASLSLTLRQIDALMRVIDNEMPLARIDRKIKIDLGRARHKLESCRERAVRRQGESSHYRCRPFPQTSLSAMVQAIPIKILRAELERRNARRSS